VPTPIKHDAETTLGALKALARLLARQLAREHFARSTQQNQRNEPSDPGEIRSEGNE
jgi:hypothetical protein